MSVWYNSSEWNYWFHIKPIQFNSVAQSCPTLCDPMNCSMPGLPVHHQLPEFTQTHVHRVSDALQPSHPLSSPSPPALNPSQHQSLFQWVNSSHEVAKVLEFQLYTHSVHNNGLCMHNNVLYHNLKGPLDERFFILKNFCLKTWRICNGVFVTFKDLNTIWSFIYTSVLTLNLEYCHHYRNICLTMLYLMG